MIYSSQNLPENFRNKLCPEDKNALGVAGLCMEELMLRYECKSEKALQRQISQYLRLHEIPFRQSRMDRKTTTKRGVEDFSICLPPSGRYLAVEVKMPGKDPTPEQAAELEAIRAAGGIAVVIHSLAELKTVLDCALVGFSSAPDSTAGKDLLDSPPASRPL